MERAKASCNVDKAMQIARSPTCLLMPTLDPSSWGISLVSTFTLAFRNFGMRKGLFPAIFDEVKPTKSK
jgi:hypothetical protein